MNESNRIYHRSPMQTEKFQPESERIMPETRCTEFPALSIDPRVGISRDRCLIIFLTCDIKHYYLSFVISFTLCILRRITTFFRTSFAVFDGGAKMTTLLKFRVLTLL